MIKRQFSKSWHDLFCKANSSTSRDYWGKWRQDPFGAKYWRSFSCARFDKIRHHDITPFTKPGGLLVFATFFDFFFLKCDFWAPKWSQEVQNIFLDSLEVFLKKPHKIFHFSLFLQKVGGFSVRSLLQKMPLEDACKGQKWPSSQKMRFFQSVR